MKAMVAIVLFSILCITPAYAKLSTPILNPEFIKWQENLNNQLSEKHAPSADTSIDSSETTIQRPLTGRPSPVDESHLFNTSIVPQGASGQPTVRNAVPVPTETSYDLRALNRNSAIRAQDPYGTCWAFSALSSAESTRRSSHGTQLDFSEKHLAYYGYTNQSLFLVSFDKHSIAYPYSVYDQGGNDSMSAAILARASGLISESTEPYINMGPSEISYSLPAAVAPKPFPEKAYELKSTYFAPAGAHVVNNMKYLLKKYGALSTMVHFDNKYFDTTHNSFFQNVQTSPNHCVTVVGWDDSYPKENFNSELGTTPQRNGAWIIQNSWGSGWGDQGYFYASYETLCIVNGGARAFVIAPAKKDSSVYSHTPLGHTATSGLPGYTDEWIANKFVAKNNLPLQEVSLYTVANDTTVTFYIYDTGVAISPTDGTLMYTSEAHTFPISGFHTIKLKRPVKLTEAHAFSIVAKLHSTSAENLVPLETPLDNYSSKAHSFRGDSYASDDGVNWEDVINVLPNTSVCLSGLSYSGSVDLTPIRTLLLSD
ncbi:MAG: lectin like domain-containing protein [Desulfovibrio sp.]